MPLPDPSSETTDAWNADVEAVEDCLTEWCLPKDEAAFDDCGAQIVETLFARWFGGIYDPQRFKPKA